MRNVAGFVIPLLLIALCSTVQSTMAAGVHLTAPYMLFLAVIIPSSVMWGIQSSLFATASSVAASIFVAGPAGRTEWLELAIFALVGVAVCVFGHVFRRTLGRHKEIEERLLMAQRCAAVGTWDWNLDTDERFWSSGYLDIFGLEEGIEANGQNFRTTVHPDDLEKIDEAAARALATGEYRVEYRLHPSRGEKWILGVGRVVQDASGRSARMTGIVMDITALKRAGTALRETRDRYEALTEFAPLSILLGSRDGKISYCNGNWVRTTGLSLSASLGDGWKGAIYPGDRGPLKAWGAAMAASKPFELELRVASRNDEPFRWHLVKGVPLSGDDGTVQQWLIVLADIHERKNYEEWIKRLGDNLPDGAIYQIISRSDGSSHFTYVSAGIEGLFGVTPAQVLQDPKLIYSMILDEDLPGLRSAEESARRERRTYEHEFRQRTLSGDIKWVLCRAAPQFFDDGTVAWSGVVIDITGRKQVEDALKRSEERFRLATNAVIGTVYDWDIDGGHVYRSEGLERLTGIAPADADPTMEWWRARIDVADRSALEQSFSRFFGSGGDHFTFEYRIRRDNGKIVDVLDQGYVLRGADGRIVRVVGCISDMSEQKQIQNVLEESEEKFRTLADTLPQLVWSALPSGICDYFNERWYEYTGMSREDRDPFDPQWTHPTDREVAIASWKDSLETGTPFQQEFRLRSRIDAKHRWFIGRALPIRDEQGRIVRWFGTCTDVDEHRTLLEEREALLESERAARSEAEKASYSKDQFVAVLSHELRAPLHAILGWAQMMKRGKLDSAGIAQAIEVIEKNTRLQAQLISDLLDINRIVSGKIKLELQDIELETVIDAAVKTLMPSAEAKGIKIVREDHAGNACIPGDASRLQQVVWNLLSNAVKFSAKDSTIRILTERIERWVRLSVIDTGEGIDPAFVPKIFQRYTQADHASVRKHGGLGLGLSIVKHLVELHGGHVSVESAGKGQGSTFSIMLCMTPSNRRAHKVERVERDDVRLNGIRVLVVDDEPDSRELIQRILVDSEATVSTVDGADEALAAVPEFKPHVIVSDVGMPGKDGYTFVKELREFEGTQKSTPAIALTAFARAEDRSRALRSGFQTHLAKPVDASELVLAVGNLARANSPAQGSNRAPSSI